MAASRLLRVVTRLRRWCSRWSKNAAMSGASATSSGTSTCPPPKSTHAPRPKPNAEPSKPPTPTSSPTTYPSGTKTPDCSTGSPNCEPPRPRRLCAALGPQLRPPQARQADAAHNPALLIRRNSQPTAAEYRVTWYGNSRWSPVLLRWENRTGDACPGPLRRRLCGVLPQQTAGRTGQTGAGRVAGTSGTVAQRGQDAHRARRGAGVRLPGVQRPPLPDPARRQAAHQTLQRRGPQDPAAAGHRGTHPPRCPPEGGHRTAQPDHPRVGRLPPVRGVQRSVRRSPDG